MPEGSLARTEADRALRSATAPDVKVWDPFVRVFHWSLVAAFITAFASAEEWDDLHEIAGFTVLGLISLRIIWGLIGTRHARFSDFVYKPRTVIAYLKDTLKMRAKRYLGHNPAGGAMVIALLLALATITATGVMMTTDAFWGVKWVKEVHELAVNGTLVLIGLHLAGVLVACLEHRENLVRSLFTGRKRKE